MSIKAPIYAISSSNDSGYSSVFTANGFDKPLAIYGHHEDNLMHQDAFLQSPFTNQHVGGFKHRHVPINTGSDNDYNRIESMAIKAYAGSIYIFNPQNNSAGFPTLTYDANIPYSIVPRNVWTKRPVNIANIFYDTSSVVLGNYTKSYQFFQTSNRAANNFAFVERNGYSVTNQETLLNSGTYDYTLQLRSLPNGTFDQSVIVEKFSAPGGAEVMSEGFLDVYSGQFSVYNALPYRNLRSRRPYLISSSIPMSSWGGYESGSTTIASIHKVNQNPRRIMVYSNVVTPTYATSSEKDDAFRNHSIPRTDSQYTWITASINTTTDQSTLFFLNVLSMSADIVLFSSASVMDGIFSVYGWPTWRQIRNYERTSVTYLRRNNLFGDLSSINSYSRATNFIVSNYKTVTPMTIKYKPTVAIVASREV